MQHDSLKFETLLLFSELWLDLIIDKIHEPTVSNLTNHIVKIKFFMENQLKLNFFSILISFHSLIHHCNQSAIEIHHLSVSQKKSKVSFKLFLDSACVLLLFAVNLNLKTHLNRGKAIKTFYHFTSFSEWSSPLWFYFIFEISFYYSNSFLSETKKGNFIFFIFVREI